jgi:hypothetical protein
MSILKRLFSGKRQSKRDCARSYRAALFPSSGAAEISESSDSIILNCPLGPKIRDLQQGSLRALINDLNALSNERPVHTVVRHLAGDIAEDLAIRFGDPEDRLLVIADAGDFTLSLVYPKRLWATTSINAVMSYAQESLIKRYEEYVSVLLERARERGDERSVQVLAGR